MPKITNAIFESEAAFESRIRALISNQIASKDKKIYALDSKKSVDIVVCRDTDMPAAFFLEVKYFQRSHGRLGFGSGDGVGFQPEILRKKPPYFEKHLRWILGSDSHEGAGFWFVTCATMQQFVAGGMVEAKYNNIREALFREHPSLSEFQLVDALRTWFYSV